MTKHSPAPWKLFLGKDGEECPHIQDAEGHVIAEFYSSSETITYLSRKTQEANATVCHAAPELLEAAEAVRDGWPKNLTEPMARLNAAISKARPA